MKIIEKNIAKPFVKWAGGKTQLINEIDKAIQKNRNDRFTYIEPFVGGGAVLFWILENFQNLDKVVINDINSDLITTYNTIKNNVFDLIKTLKIWETEYHVFKELPEERKEYYYKKRELFNSRTENSITHSALFIFLNRTCFNGLYRVNSNNGFNVPIGSYKTPMICDEENLQSVNKALQKVEILNGDFSETIKFATNNTIFYLDPPYKPLSETSSFNSYSKDEFNDNEQIRLKEFCDKIDLLGHHWILSNSDVKGKNPHDNFFDELYQKYNIFRVKARRNINANGEKRGELNELLITNYQITDYIPALKLNKEDLFVRNYDKPYWVIQEKVAINKIKIDKKLFSYANPIYEETVNSIINNFEITAWIPITINKDFFLLDGQHRLEAAKRMKLKYIDVVIQDTELLEANQTKTKYRFKKVIL